MRWVLGLVLALGLVVSASAEVPQQLHYNGYLTNAVGDPVECPDAIQCGDTYDITFRLYDSEDSDTPIWSETKVSVSFYGGSFHAMLGSGTPITPELLTGPVWLGVKVNNNAEMLPRQQVASAAYAIKAGTVEHAENAAQLGGLNPEDFASTESVTELQTIINGTDDDTLAALGCAPGQVAKAAEGGWVCADAGESDTTLTEPEVDAMVANNGYAVQSELEAAQAALTELQTLVNNIDTSTGVNIAGLQYQITALEVVIATLDSNLSTETTARTNADLTLQGDIASLDSSLALVAKSGSYTHLTDLPSDSDTLAALSCAEGQVPVQVAGAWTCGENGTSPGDGIGGTVYKMRCAWQGSSGASGSSCVPSSCSPGWIDLGLLGNTWLGTINDGSNGTYSTSNSRSFGYSERGCYHQNVFSLIQPRCIWVGSTATSLSSCTPPACPPGWSDLGISGNVKNSANRMVGGNLTNSGHTQSTGYSERTCTH